MRIILFSVVSFLSAWFLFQIQPMITKVLLPYLGGTPYVWNTALMVFQILLLAGYAYSYWVISLRSLRMQLAVHAGLYLLVATCFLPLQVFDLPVDGVSEQPIIWMISIFAATVALPFFALAANAPLIQYWFSCSGDKAQNPYPLYSASNAGSLLALLAYPLWIEWQFDLYDQTTYWGWGVRAFAALLIAVGFYSIVKTPRDRAAAPVVNASQDEDVAITWRRRGLWVLFSLLPCSLMMSVTTYITTDVASTPLFWVIPLMIYLLSIIIAFSDRALPAFKKNYAPIPMVLFCVAALYYLGDVDEVLVHLLFLFMISTACHMQVVKHKPGVRRLGEFYLWMSFGGALGGVINVVIVPLIFVIPLEYPLTFMIAIVALAHMHMSDRKGFGQDVLAVLTAAIPALLFVLAISIWPQQYDDWLHRWQDKLPSIVWKNSPTLILLMWLCTPLAIYLFLWMRNVRRQAMLLSLFIFLYTGYHDKSPGLREMETFRNFFGVYRVLSDKALQTNKVLHNTTTHGLQSQKPDRRLDMTSYYQPVKMIYRDMLTEVKDKPVAVAGLGIGTVFCAFGQGRQVDIFEIDPQVIELAKDDRYFTYYRDCPVEKRTVVGDARLKLAEEPDGKYGFIIIDAFSSDSVPVHLLTKEAIDMYFSKLAPGGVMAFNISNRYMDLRSIFRAYAKETDIKGYYGEFLYHQNNPLMYSSGWVVLAKHHDDLKPVVERMKNWNSLQKDGIKDVRLWTDKYSNILPILYFGKP